MKYLNFVLLATTFLIFAFGAKDTPPDVARIHVIANSDSTRDIEIKMEVAGEISRLIEEESFDSTEKIREYLEKKLPKIEEITMDILEKNSVGYGAAAEVEVRYFDKKSLGNSSFPEGEYTALIITLGEGEGHNWWSVIFPDLSFRASLASGEEGGKGKTIVVGGNTVVKLRCFLRELLTKDKKKSTITHV